MAKRSASAVPENCAVADSASEDKDRKELDFDGGGLKQPNSNDPGDVGPDKMGEKAMSAPLRAPQDTIVAALPDALALLGADLSIVFSNDRFRDLFNLPIYAARPGASILQIADEIEHTAAMGKGLRHPMRARWERMFTESEAMDHVDTVADGRSISIRHRPLSDGGTLVLFSDISDEEQRMADQSAAIRRQEFVSGELKSLTRGLTRALTDSLRRVVDSADRLDRKHGDTLSDGGRAYVDRISAAADQMTAVLHDVAEYSRLEFDTSRPDTVDLESVVQTALERLKEETCASSAVFEYNALPAIPGDAELLVQLFVHIFENALRYRRPSARPFIKLSHTSRTGTRGRPEIELTVADNGIGFDQEHTEAAFSIFQSLGDDIEEQRTGYGLAACRRIVDLHDGEICAMSKRGEGTSIIIALPTRGRTKSQDEHDDDALLFDASRMMG